MTLRDQMAELMPGLKWTRPTCSAVNGWVGETKVVWVCNEAGRRKRATWAVYFFTGDWYGLCQSPTHAAKTIRRKLREFIEIFGKALEEKT